MSREMTPRERVSTAFARQVPDRVPINYEFNPGIDLRLKEHFGLAADDHEGILRALNVDFRRVASNYVGPRLHPELPGRNVDAQSGIVTRWIEHKSGGYWDFCDFPLEHATAEELAAWPMPSPNDYDYSLIADQCAAHANYYIAVGGPGLCDIINQTGMIRTMEQTLVDLMVDDEGLLNYLDRRLAVSLEMTARILEAAKGRIDMLCMGEDLGTQNSPLISLDLYRKHIRPRQQRFVDLGNAWNIPVMIHSCGSSSWAYDDFIEMGISVVDTLQPEAVNMAPDYLKSRFGDRLSFHGCISTAGPLAYGTVEDVVKNVQETFQVMMPGGGYALAPTHAIQDNSPTENVVAMYQAAVEYGGY